MNFYFVCHTLLGLVTMCAALSMFQAANNPATTPQWAWGQTGVNIASFSAFGAVLAIITTLINFGVIWAFATAGELLLGCFIALMLPSTFRFLLGLISPIVTIVIVGALWKFWYL